jgi:hypothetical protein
MNRFSLYILLILVFLGLSKSFSPSAQKSPYIPDKEYLSSFFQGAPLSIVILDHFEAGFVIKTYYLKLKVIHGFRRPNTVIVRVTKKFWEESEKNVGMSIFRRYERESLESTLSLPPGAIYIGDPAYGRWRYHDSGNKLWRFHKAYRHFPRLFLWGEFLPSYQFYQDMQAHMKNQKSYHGPKNQFGESGSITKRNVIPLQKAQQKKDIDWKQHIINYFSLPDWKKS